MNLIWLNFNGLIPYFNYSIIIQLKTIEFIIRKGEKNKKRNRCVDQISLYTRNNVGVSRKFCITFSKGPEMAVFGFSKIRSTVQRFMKGEGSYNRGQKVAFFRGQGGSGTSI